MNQMNCSFSESAIGLAELSNSSCYRIVEFSSLTKVIAREDFFAQSALWSLMSLSKATVKVPGTGVGLYLGSFEAEIEMLAITFGGLGLLAVCAYLSYLVSTSARVSLSVRRMFPLVMAIALALVPFPLLEVYGPVATTNSSFAASLVGILGFFRLLELACKTGPKGFDSSLSRFVLYVASPAEVKFDSEGRFQQAPPGYLQERFKDMTCHGLVFILFLSIGSTSDFKPFIPEGEEPGRMSYLGYPLSLPSTELQAFLVFANLASSLSLFRFLCALIGIETHEHMRNPLMLSTSVKDFWGRRWNLLIHRLMHRSFFKPLARCVGPRSGAIAAFAVSGLFHEYMWLLANWHEKRYIYKFGGPLLFFAVQFALLTMESLLKHTWCGKTMSNLPGPILTCLTTLLILPFGPLFLRDLRGLRADSLMTFPHFSIL